MVRPHDNTGRSPLMVRRVTVVSLRLCHGCGLPPSIPWNIDLVARSTLLAHLMMVSRAILGSLPVKCQWLTKCARHKRTVLGQIGTGRLGELSQLDHQALFWTERRHSSAGCPKGQ